MKRFILESKLNKFSKCEFIDAKNFSQAVDRLKGIYGIATKEAKGMIIDSFSIYGL